MTTYTYAITYTPDDTKTPAGYTLNPALPSGTGFQPLDEIQFTFSPAGTLTACNMKVTHEPKEPRTNPFEGCEGKSEINVIHHPILTILTIRKTIQNGLWAFTLNFTIYGQSYYLPDPEIQVGNGQPNV